MSPSACADCGEHLGRKIWPFWDPNDHECDGPNCQLRLCTSCHLKRPLFVVPTEVATSTTSCSDPKNDLSKAVMRKLCKGCFQDTSTVDYDREYDVVSSSGDDSTKGTIFVFVHGGGGSRAMFASHAQELKKRYGHGSVLLDLPGHATKVDVPLSPESCAETLDSVLKENNISVSSAEKIIFVGGSLGAYVGFYLLDKFRDIFDAAVLLDCGQNVGPGRSLKAEMGLVLLKWIGNTFSNAGMINMMMDVAKKSAADYKLIETVFGAGMFFDESDAQVECLRSVSPAEHIPNLNFPILFMNGSEDYRDSEDKWLSLCTDKRSELKVYYGGDHFCKYIPTPRSSHRGRLCL